jgi:hypothetical protein
MDIQRSKPIPPKFIQHKIELHTTIPPATSGQVYVKCKLCYNSETRRCSHNPMNQKGCQIAKKKSKSKLDKYLCFSI